MAGREVQVRKRPRHREIAELEDAFVECRGPLKHALYFVDPPMPREGSVGRGHELVSVKCERCGWERHECWHRKTGELIFRRYKRPKKYTTISREWRASDLRLELLRRWNGAG